MPFKDFKEGTPSRHNTDQCKTNSKRKITEDARGKKGIKKKIEQRIWWQQWEDAEAIRFCTGFNP
jgi:hypothetical protein